MKRLLLTLASALGAATISAGQAAAAEPTVFADFQRFCLEKVGDVDTTVAAAKAAGFQSFAPQSDELAGAYSFIREEAGVRRLVSIKRSVEPAQPPLPESEEIICGIGRNEADPDLLKQASAWAGVPEDVDHSQSSTRAFSFTITASGGRQDLSHATDAEVAGVLRRDGVWLLLVNDADAPTIVLVYLRALTKP